MKDVRSRVHNLAAKFWPAAAQDCGTLPALEVAGALVFVYVVDGEDRAAELVVSIDLDTVEPFIQERGDDELVRVSVTMQGTPIFDWRD